MPRLPKDFSEDTDDFIRDYREMIKQMTEYEKLCRQRLDAQVKVFTVENNGEDALRELIPRDEYRPKLDSRGVLEVIKTLEATLTMIEIEDEFKNESGFSAWSRRHAA